MIPLWTTILIFIIYIKAESQVGTPNLTLLSKVTQGNTTKLTCVAGENVRDSAITFITPLEGNYTKNRRVSTTTYLSAQGSIYSPETYDCAFAPGSSCVTKWTQNGLVLMSLVSVTSKSHDLELVTDERWEKFPMYFSEFGKIIEHKFAQEIHSIGISVRTSGEANILLCEDKNTSQCYWITLPWEKDNRIKLSSCVNINTTDPIKKNNCNTPLYEKALPCSESNWTHYQLIMTTFNYTRTLFQIRGIENNNILTKLFIPTKLNIKKLLVYIENKKNGVWKIHDYSYLSLPLNFANNLLHKIGPAFQVDKSGSVCMELHVAVCPKCTLKLGVSHTLYTEVVRGQEQEQKQRWQLVRLKTTNLPQNLNYSLQVVAIGDSQGFWLIDAVRRCHEDETRIISTEIPIYEKDIVSCQALKQPNWWSSIKAGKLEQSNLTVCNNQTYTGTSCAVSCTAALGTDCSKIMVCEPSMSRMKSICTCAAGYLGDLCQDLCPQGYYGSGCTRQCEPCEGRCLSASGACIMDDQQTDSNSALYALLLLLIPVIFAVWFFCSRYRKISNLEIQFNMPLLKNLSHNQGIKSYPVKVKQLAQYIKRINNKKMEQQYKSLPRGLTKPSHHGMLKNNSYKNRFNEITPYDHSRVVLKVNEEDSDYINANYIDGYKQPKAYIAAQGPKANTLNDFWRMIWQENVQFIVMLTSTVDDKQVKYEQYWTENMTTREFIDISVKMWKKDVYADFILRFLEVTYQKDVRQVQHLQFTSWHDNGIPAHPQLLVPFLQEMRLFSLSTTPIVIHCRSGIGRSGTVILLDICLRMAEQTGKINPLKYLHRMREQRVDMVASFDQYKLVHAVLLEYLLAPDSSIHCDNELPNVISNITENRLLQEISYLNKSEWHNTILRNDATSSDEISEVVSYPCDGEFVSFDNVVSVDGFRAKDQYMVIPSIQGNALKKFWTIIIKHNVEVAFVLEDLSICDMWPNKAEQILELPDLTIKCISISEGSSYSTYRFQLQMKSSLMVRSVRVLVQSPGQMSAQALAQLAADALAAAQRWRPMAVGGAAGAGLVVLAHVMERMLARHQCDVLGSLRALRACGLNCLLDQHQLQLLYSASVYALDE